MEIENKVLKHKYEILILSDPKSDESEITKMVTKIFGNDIKNIEKQEYSKLEYEINKSKIGVYHLVLLETTGEQIIEFNRVANIQKKLIWRQLAINLDSEKSLNRRVKPKRVRKTNDFSRNNSDRNDNRSQNTSWTPKNNVDSERTDRPERTYVKRSSSSNENKEYKRKPKI